MSKKKITKVIDSDEEDNTTDEKKVADVLPDDNDGFLSKEHILEKFDDKIRKQVILDNHRELIQESYDEIQLLTKVIRNEFGEIIDPLHRTLPFLTKYEKTKILGVRTRQLNQGAEPFIKIPPTLIDSEIIADKELESKMLPFIIVRPLPSGKKEFWKLDDLEYINF
jgi:DNA-directed RNA polymerase subunit K/omega